MRTGEAKRSASLLGVDAVTFLDLPDKPQVNIGPTLLRDLVPVAFQKSSLVVTHGSCGEYGHKSHIALHRAVKTAALNSAQIPSVLGMNAWRPKATIPQIINREERPEGISAGCARLVGTDENMIVQECSRLMDDEEAYASMANTANPYGNGTAAATILQLLEEKLTAHI